VNFAFTPWENEILLTQTAALRKADSEAGPGVVLVPLNKTLCRTEDEDQARLIVKLFNRGLSSES